MGAFEWRTINCPTCDVDDTMIMGFRGGQSHRDGAGERCRIVRCKRCHLIYANPFPVPMDINGLYSAEEDFFKHHAHHELKVQERSELVDRMERLLGAPGRLFDFGAGTGETILAAKRRGWDAYGVEISERFAKEAEQHCGDRICHGGVGDIPPRWSDQPYDAIVLAAVLEHLHDPASVLTWIGRALRPGGILFVDVPNEEGLYFRAANAYFRVTGRDWVSNLAPTFSPFHVFGFSKRSLRAFLQRYGLQPEVFRIYSGRSLLPLQKSVRGLVEWAGSHTVHTLSGMGDLGTYIECFARKTPRASS